MGMGHTDDPLLVLPRPALRRQLFAGVEQEIAVPAMGVSRSPRLQIRLAAPAIARRPDVIQPQRGALARGSDQQSTSLLRPARQQGALQNREASTTQLQRGWRDRSCADTLCGPYEQFCRFHERRHHRS